MSHPLVPVPSATRFVTLLERKFGRVQGIAKIGHG
jgi:hypothetical protein